MTKEDGGPAFPQQTDITLSYKGMTLRDYFAAKAMQSILLEYQNVFEDETGGEGDPTFPELLAKDAYIMADAMLKVREQ